MALPFLGELKSEAINNIPDCGWSNFLIFITRNSKFKIQKFMSWYLAKLVFRIICGDGDHTPQFDEQLRLFSASSKEEAFKKAQLTGAKEEETFYNQRQQIVQWQFINVSEIYKISQLIDGAELYSRIEERDNAEAYIYIVNQKAENILHTQTHQLLQLV
jgi:hypothetical protein